VFRGFGGALSKTSVLFPLVAITRTSLLLSQTDRCFLWFFPQVQPERPRAVRVLLREVSTGAPPLVQITPFDALANFPWHSLSPESRDEPEPLHFWDFSLRSMIRVFPYLSQRIRSSLGERRDARSIPQLEIRS